MSRRRPGRAVAGIGRQLNDCAFCPYGRRLDIEDPAPATAMHAAWMETPALERQ